MTRGGEARAACVTLLLVMAALLAAPACGAKRRNAKEPVPPERVYEMAVRKMKKKKYYRARTMLQDLLPRIPPDDRDLLPRVQLAIADSYFAARGLLNFGEALNSYRNFLTYFPDHPKADHAQYMVAMSLFEQVLAPDRDQSLTRRAIDEFRKVETLYPESPYVEKARRKIEEGFDLLAEHERVIGWFYQKRKIWGAAISRYRTILIEYPRYSKRSRVLFDLGRCLLAAGKRTEAEAFFERLSQEASDSDMVAEAEKLLAKDERRRARAARRERR
ncbi:MAG: outer membrane protein assembly factor BamD [Acidobacteriota bacterium]